MVTDWPATCMVALRADDDVLAATVYETVPLPLPLPPLVMVIHVLLSVAAHAHPAEVVTVMLPELPFAAIDAFVGDTE
jgi:hypothetical protein